MIGSTIAHYRVTAKLGEGGMGEVYRATDTKLDREVAMKVLPPAFIQDAERLARFEREAKLLAQLHHPNIASIFGLEESDGTRALVMELVEGPTLAERLESGPLPVKECLAVALQLALALEEAHEKGIVHRDLKPQNIKAAVDGKVKVLDFGLAKAMDPAGVASGAGSAATMAKSPTLTMGATVQGMILGTAAYMAPEQAKGMAVDKRSDIWAFGVVLYEMLCGGSLFAGDSVGDTLAAVIRAEIDLGRLPPETPAAIRRLLRRCLERSPRSRLHDIADARIVLEEWMSGQRDEPGVPAASAEVAAPTRARERFAWVAAALGLLLGVGAAWMVSRQPATTVPLTTRFTVLPAEPGLIEGFPALSPDGRSVAYAHLGAGGASGLWIHDFGSGTAVRLAGTEGAQDPFWSPDGKNLAFFARGELRRLGIASGVTQTVCPAADARGGAWGSRGDLLFTPNSAAALFRVSANGGAAAPVTELRGGEQSHRFPWFLPDGRRFLYTVNGNPAVSGVYWANLDDGERRRLVPEVSMAAYDPRGFLVFVRQGTLLAQRFDAEAGELSGEAAPIAEDVGVDPQKTGKFFFGLSAGGAVAVRTGTLRTNQMLWFDRAGQRVGVLAASGYFAEPTISPDGSRVAVQRTVERGGSGDLWIFEASGTDRSSRLTFGPASAETPIWSPDGARVVFSSPREKGYAIVAKASSGVGAEEVLAEIDATAWPDDWSPDGRFVVLERYGPGTGGDLWLLPTTGERTPMPFLESPANEAHATFSPDGRYLAYTSDETGTPQIYVQTVPASGSKWQVSADGGDQASWRADGAELYFVNLERVLTAVPVRSLSPFSVGEPQPLFPLRIPAISPTGNRTFYSATRDGQRFVVNALSGDESEPGIRVTLNWIPPGTEP